MLTINDLKPGTVFLFAGQPFEILESKHLHLGRKSGAVLQTKIKNLKTGAILQRNFKSSDSLEEIDVSREKIKYIYSYRGKYYFSKKEKSSERFFLNEKQVGESKKFLKRDTEIEAIKLEDEIINIALPIKVDLKVSQAPPGFRGDTAERNTKRVFLETGYELKVPLFIKEGDIVRVNTSTGEYVERVTSTVES